MAVAVIMDVEEYDEFVKAKKDFEQVKKLLKHACEFSSDYNVVHYKDFGNGDHLMSVDMDDIRTIIDFVKL